MTSTRPVEERPWVITNSVKMKMTVSLLKPLKASSGVSTPEIARIATTESALTSSGIASVAKSTIASSTMPRTR